jgi:hypothetical protein
MWFVLHRHLIRLIILHTHRGDEVKVMEAGQNRDDFESEIIGS